jgi:LacI family transcriptional regulator
LHDVARRAGVSLATASRAFNGSKDRVVGGALRDRVLIAATELGYAPNPYAQAMARGRTNVVGLVVHDIADPFFASVAAGVMREAEEHGLLVTMASTQGRPQGEVDHIATLRNNWAKVVVLVGSRFYDREQSDRVADELAAFESSGGRAVAVSQPLLSVDTVTIENRTAAGELADAIYDLGHRRFGILCGPRDLVTASERLAGFRDALVRHGAPVRSAQIVAGEFTRDGGYAAMNRLLDEGADMTCVFAVNDVMAVGAMAALRERNIRLPEGMAVAGFDDIATLRDVSPALTTVRVPLEEVGVQALRLALDDGVGRPRVRRVSGTVVIRASTPPLMTTQ